MTTPPLPREVIEQTLSVLQACGGNQTRAAEVLNISRGALQNRLKAARRAGIELKREWRAPTLVDANEDERRRQALSDEVSQLRRQLREAHRADIDAERVRTEILGLAAQTSAEHPSWVVEPAKDGQGGPGVPVTQWSDWHIQEVVRAAETGGLNEFNSEVARLRVRLLIDRVCTLCFDHMVNPTYPGIVVVLGGDMITGEIHPALAETNDLTTPQGIIEAYDLVRPALGTMADRFGKVLVVCVAGNHARDTMKPRMKRYAHRNFDWLLYCFLERAFKDDDRIQFIIPEETDALFRVYGHRFLATHGDNMGVRGGDGIIGAIGPIIRGRVKIHTSESQIGRDFDTLLVHHWHQFIHIEGLIVNPSLKGYDEFTRLALRARYQPAAQNLFFVHRNRGITCSWPIILQDGAPNTGAPWSSWHSGGWTAKLKERKAA